MASIFLLCFSFLLSDLASALYYYPNSSEASDDFPYDPDTEHSPYCSKGPGAMCLSNRSCKGSGQGMIRGTCTDKTWGSLDCPLYCYLLPSIGPDLISCSNVTGKDTSFCCDHTVGCCDSGDGRFELLPSNPEPWATWDSSKSQFVVVKPLSTAKTITTAPSSASTTASTTAPALSTATTAAVTTTSGLPPPAQTTTDSPGQTESSSGLSTAAQAGIGVGASVGTILLGLVAYLLWKNSHLKRDQNQYQQQQHLYSPGPIYPGHEFPYQPGMHAYPGVELLVEMKTAELDGLPRPAELPGSRF